MKCLVLLAIIVCASALTEQETMFLFKAWKVQEKKGYSNAIEEAFRYNVFAHNAEFIEAENKKGHTYTLGLTPFADMTRDEFKEYVNMCRVEIQRGFPALRSASTISTANLPASIDWSQKGGVTPVKNQQQCGSCWAFSATGAMEGISFIATGTLPSLSEQQLVDCSQAEGNMGCNGGLMDYAFQYVIDNHGICSEQAYPYIAQDSNCKSSQCTPVATISGYQDVAQNDEDALQAAVAQQPVSVAIEADGMGFQFYTGGVYDDAFCGTNLDHGVLAVGYGTDGKDYWKVKNSWGASWGEAGYIRMKRAGGKTKGMCGIAMQPSYPTK